jgi:hypothetical protein
MSRQSLLPPYLQDAPAWGELMESLDTVFKDRVDDPTRWLSRLRDTWILTPEAEAKIQQGLLLDNVDWEEYEKEILIRQANMLGFDFKEADILTSDDYQRITRNLSVFWYGKGTPSFIQFLSFVFNSIVTIKNLWSTAGATPDAYGPFIAEGEPGIGTPVWDGGTWFPTTHVQVGFDIVKFPEASVTRLLSLFYALANYNLVIESVQIEGTLYISSRGEPEDAIIAVAYPGWDYHFTIETIP